MILIDVYIPAVDEVFDFELDEHAKIQQILREIIEMISKKTKSKSVGRIEDFFLYDMKSCKALRSDMTLCSYNIQDGSNLMLV